MNDLPSRKQNRLTGYDYSANGAYFITVCTEGKKCILSDIKVSSEPPVGAGIARPPKPKLSEYGKIVDNAINEIPSHYSGVTVDNYVIMPNHIHLLIRIDNGNVSESGRPMVAPTVSRIIQQFKGYVTKQAGLPLWQKLFYDHIIRDEADYEARYNYIDDNPRRWSEDELFATE